MVRSQYYGPPKDDVFFCLVHTSFKVQRFFADYKEWYCYHSIRTKFLMWIPLISCFTSIIYYKTTSGKTHIQTCHKIISLHLSIDGNLVNQLNPNPCMF